MEAFRNARPIAGDLLTTCQEGNGSAHLLTDDDLRTEREPVKEPSKRWRNWWRNLYNGVDLEAGFHRAGEIYPGFGVYPSKEIAEARALEALTNPPGSPSGWANPLRMEYLGAFPTGERP